MSIFSLLFCSFFHHFEVKIRSDKCICLLQYCRWSIYTFLGCCWVLWRGSIHGRQCLLLHQHCHPHFKCGDRWSAKLLRRKPTLFLTCTFYCYVWAFSNPQFYMLFMLLVVLLKSSGVVSSPLQFFFLLGQVACLSCSFLEPKLSVPFIVYYCLNSALLIR